MAVQIHPALPFERQNMHINANIFGVSPDNPDNTSAFNQAIGFCAGKKLYVPSGRYVFKSKPNAFDCSIVGDGPSQTVFVRDYSGDDFLEFGSGNGYEFSGIQILAAAGTSGGTGFQSIATQNDAADFCAIDNVIVTFEYGGSFGAESFVYDGSARPGMGVRDSKIKDLYVFGDVLLKSCVNLNATGLWCNDLKIDGVSSAISTDFNLSMVAVGNIDISHLSGANIRIAAQGNTKNISVDGNSANIIISTGADLPDDNINIVNGTTALLTARGPYQKSGTFTPTVTGIVTQDTLTYVGRYTLIGKKVFCEIEIHGGDFSCIQGQTKIENLPYDIAKTGVLNYTTNSYANGTGWVSAQQNALFPSSFGTTNYAVFSFNYDVT